MRLIDADSLLKSIDELQKSPWYKRGRETGANPLETAEYMSRKDAFSMIRDLCIFREPTVEAAPIRHGHWIEVENPSYSPFDGSGEHLYVCSRCFMTHPRKSVFCGCCGTQLIETETDDDEFEIKTYVKGKKDIPSDEEVKYTYKKIKEDINAETRD